MRAGGHQVRLDPTVVAWALTGKINQIIRALRIGIGGITAIRADRIVPAIGRRQGPDIGGGPHGDYVFGRTRSGNCFGARPIVAGRKDNYHFLITSGRMGRSRRLRIADQRVKRLRIGIILSVGTAIIAPAIIADARTLLIRGRH